MKSVLIISVLNSFDFPLREATRKQVWWTASKFKVEGCRVEIWIIGAAEKVAVDHEGIRINFRRSDLLVTKYDEIRLITGSIVLPILNVLRFSGRKTLTLTDGYMLGTRLRSYRLLLALLFGAIFQEINVYSYFQKTILRHVKSVKVVDPILPDLTPPLVERTEQPSLLYMGHLSEVKGVDTILRAFEVLISEYPEIQLVIANNSIKSDELIVKKVEDFVNRFPHSIVMKGIVSPLEELKKAWVYLYPFQEAMGTMAFALSLYEAEVCGTPYIACRIGANEEFFNTGNLIDVGDYESMIEKIKEVIDVRPA